MSSTHRGTGETCSHLKRRFSKDQSFNSVRSIINSRNGSKVSLKTTALVSTNTSHIQQIHRHLLCNKDLYLHPINLYTGINNCILAFIFTLKTLFTFISVSHFLIAFCSWLKMYYLHFIPGAHPRVGEQHFGYVHVLHMCVCPSSSTFGLHHLLNEIYL